MIIKTKAFQESCKKILDAVGTATAVASATLELEAHGQVLYLNVTDREYYVTVQTLLDFEAEIHAVVNAHLFLGLINKTTTPTIELSVTSTTLTVKANGTYKIPIIFDKDAMVVMPKIEIGNVTSTFNIPNTVLQSILKYNSKELVKNGGGSSPTRLLFYVDERGAVTYSDSACVNSFTLEQPVVVTLTERIVKLFKLFKAESINFTMGFDALPNGMMVTKVCFSDEQVIVTSLLPVDETLISKFPVAGIRKWAEDQYNYTVTIDRLALVEAITRLSLFCESANKTNHIYMSFGQTGVTLYDINKDNHEQVVYVNNCDSLLEHDYEAVFDTNTMKLTLETLEGQYIVLSFGNKTVALIQRDNITTIVPECN